MINPIALEIFGLTIYWYGIFYMLGFIFSYFFILYFAKDFGFKKEKIEDIIFFTMLFSVLGGRLGYILFYNLEFYLSNIFEIFAVWNGGMSIHGGFIGGFLSLYYFSKKEKYNLLKLCDLFVIPASLALAFGRLANFINQELVGKITNSSIGIVFPRHDNEIRWPSTIFDGFKSLITFQILLYLQFFKNLAAGTITALFIILYNLGRFFIDFLREPDILIGFLSMGQVLCLIFTLFGFWLLIKVQKSENSKSNKIVKKNSIK